MQLSSSPMTAGKGYDIFAYPIDGSTFGLELSEWSDPFTRAVDITRVNGRYAKVGDTTRTYVGSAYCGVTGQVNDGMTKRTLFNYFNQERRHFYWTEPQDHSYTTGAWRYYNANSGNFLEVFTGLYRSVDLVVSLAANSASGAPMAGVTYPNASIVTSGAYNYAQVPTNQWSNTVPYRALLTGYGCMGICQYGVTGATYYDLSIHGWVDA